MIEGQKEDQDGWREAEKERVMENQVRKRMKILKDLCRLLRD